MKPMHETLLCCYQQTLAGIGVACSAADLATYGVRIPAVVLLTHAQVQLAHVALTLHL